MTTITENTITGTDGDDQIDILIPRDADYPQILAFGEGGNDRIVINSAIAVIAHGGDGNDILGVTDANTDTLFGDAGNDTIDLSVEDKGIGGDVDDYFGIRNGTGNFTGYARGGNGNDVFVLDTVPKMNIDGGDGEDTVVYTGTVGKGPVRNVETAGLTGDLYADGHALDGFKHVVGYDWQGGRYMPSSTTIRLEFRSRAVIDGSAFDESLHGELVGSDSNDIFDFSGSSCILSLLGGDGNDALIGGGGNDSIQGGNGSDTLIGGGGDDIIDTGWNDPGHGNVIDAGRGNDQIILNDRVNTLQGGAGDDTIETYQYGYTRNFEGGYQGGGGDDTFMFGGELGKDLTMAGGKGHDTLIYSGKLNAAAEIDLEQLDTTYIATSPKILSSFDEINIVSKHLFMIQLTAKGTFSLDNVHGLDRVGQVQISGSVDNQKIDVSSDAHEIAWNIAAGGGDDRVTGSSFSDVIKGGDGDDVLLGGAGGDSIDGGNGDDVLWSTGGKVRLTGGAGDDIFILDQKAGGDRVTDIADMTWKETIRLDHDVFESLAIGGLHRDEFYIGTKLTDDDQRILYNVSTGRLYYDPDGAGGEHGVLIARLDAGLNLTAGNFDVVA